METILAPDYSTMEELDTVMSNLFREIDQAVAANLIHLPNTYALYTGWNFCGKIWWFDGSYHCQVFVYGSHKNIVSGTLEEIMKTVSDQYGYE